MKTLYIYTQFLYPGQISEAVLLSDIVEFASQSFKGQVVCVCATKNDTGSEWYSAPNLKIIRQNPPRFNKDNVVQRIIAFAFIALRFWWHAIWNVKKDDSVFTVTLTPGFFMFLLYLLRSIRKFQYILLVYDVFPDNLIPGGIGEGKLWFRFLKMVFTKVYRKVDKIITIGCDMRERISWMTHSTENITIIQNWANAIKVVPREKNSLEITKKLGLQDKIVFAFIGNFSKARSIENLLEIADKISNPLVRILFFGKGLSFPLIEHYLKDNPNGKVIYGGSFSIQDQENYLNACDVALITLGAKMYGIGVPSKAYYNMACGKPLLVAAEDGTEIAEMTRTYHLGEVVPPCDSEKLLAAIEKMADQHDLQELGNHVHRVFLDHFSKEQAAKKYHSFFSS